MEPRLVNKGLRAPAKCPNDPQAFLHRSNHPYAPFTGNALKWESYVFDDGTTYEGLCREEVPHGKGVMMMGSGTGGGIQNPSKGDMYEGEFFFGFAHGLGQYFSRESQEVYRGEFYAGKRQGCGMVLDISPFERRIKKGMEPAEAWKETKDKIYRRVKYGTWKKDYFIAEPDEKGTRYCHINEIKGTLEELEAVLTKARMFQWKPDGEVTFMFAQDGNGMPLNLMQDPLHYPHGTKFMAPGPLGQCHNCPDDEDVRRTMIRHATNYQRIHDMYNLDYDPPPGSNLYNALRLREKKARDQQARREARAAKTASARAGRSSKKAKGRPSTSAASLTMNLVRGVGCALNHLGDGMVSVYHGPRLTRPSRTESEAKS